MKKDNFNNVILDFSSTYLPEQSFKQISHKITKPQNFGDDFYSELIIGGILGFLELNIAYEHEILGKTPDWTILDDKQKPLAIVECSQMHIDYETDKKTSISDDEKTTINSYWMDEESNNSNRLYEKLAEKASKYKKLVKAEQIGYIISIYINSKLVFFEDEIKPLFYGEFNFFDEFPEITGIILVSESGLGDFIFKFQYWSKPVYIRTDMLPSELLIDIRNKTIIPKKK